MLRELLRQAERILDKQVVALEQELARTEGTTRLAVAAVAGVIATAGIVGRLSTLWVFAGFGAATVCLCIAIILTLDFQGAFGRHPRGLWHGVDLHTVIREASTRSWDDDELLVMTVARMSGILAENESALKVRARRRGRASSWIVLGVFVLLLTLAFIAGGTVHG